LSNKVVVLTYTVKYYILKYITLSEKEEVYVLGIMWIILYESWICR